MKKDPSTPGRGKKGRGAEDPRFAGGKEQAHGRHQTQNRASGATACRQRPADLGLKTVVNTAIIAEGWVPSHRSPVKRSVRRPAQRGGGPIRPHTSIIFDIFPRGQNRLLRRLSRTVVRGRVPPAETGLRRQAGQKIALRDPPRRGAEFTRTFSLFERRGFPTGKIDEHAGVFRANPARPDIHRPPRSSPSDAALWPAVVTWSRVCTTSAWAASGWKTSCWSRKRQPQAHAPPFPRNLTAVSGSAGSFRL